MNWFRTNTRRRLRDLENAIIELAAANAITQQSLTLVADYIDRQPTDEEFKEFVETMVQNYLNDSDWNTGQGRGDLTQPIHGIYVGGLGQTVGNANLTAYNTIFDLTDYGPTCLRVFDGKYSQFVSDSDVTAARIRQGFDGSESIQGVAQTFSFSDIGAGADAGIANGDYDDYIDFVGDTLAQMASEGATPIVLVPFNEVVGSQTGSGAVQTVPPDGTNFKAAFIRIVTRIKAKVTVDHVILHLNSTNRSAMDEYIPDDTYWDSYGLTVYENDSSRGFTVKEINDAWSYLQINHPDKIMSMPEWKTGNTGIDTFAPWPAIQEVFDLDIPFYIFQWGNKDGVTEGAPLNYPEMRWQNAEANAKAKWINEWKKIEDLR